MEAGAMEDGRERKEKDQCIAIDDATPILGGCARTRDEPLCSNERGDNETTVGQTVGCML